MPSTWTLMNLLMLGCCWAAIWFGLNRYEEATRVLLAMQAEGLAASQRVERFFYYEYGGVRLVACVVFMMWLRTFQYHRVTTQVLETLQRSRFDLVSYFFMYVVLHCAFAQAGYYLFGDQSSAFKTFSESLLAVLAIALGEMGSDVFIRAHWVVGPLFFILLIFVIIFVFHNMFFVILSYNYDSVREERSQLDRGLNFMSFMKNGFRNFCKMRGLRLPPHDPLVDMERRLMRCGFSPGSLQAFRAFLKPRQQQQEAKGRGVGLELQPNMASLADLNAVEDEIALMERELLQAKSEISSLVSSLSGDFAGMES
ncbi:polycystic kidney disease 2-like 2 protein [Frankliniella occidentalis]|uniref:Polycystic kidney disease 2-like 2 protein n=1 Tax=Frankliniella occidentalis TaxID=133901 RepID=A0A9C6XAY5_FRAOC|nr:polycystic kidney disease 2-like 2 protein [Frankliniella occidentalis]